MTDSEGFFAALKRNFVNPVVAIATLILISIFILIGTAIFGWDKGHVLAGMSQIEFARGLITYLFAIVTIGTAVVLVVSVLTNADSAENDKRFERGKEILSLLLGVFGTIVGFYFGSEISAKGAGQEQIMRVIPLRLGSATVASKAQFTLETFVSGGQSPYRYGVAVGAAAPDLNERVENNGWITVTLTAPDVTSEQKVPVKLMIRDNDGHTTEEATTIQVTPPK